MPRATYTLNETGQPIGKRKLTEMARMAAIIANVDDTTPADLDDLCGWPSVVIAGTYFDVPNKVIARMVWRVWESKGWREPLAQEAGR